MNAILVVCLALILIKMVPMNNVFLLPHYSRLVYFGASILHTVASVNVEILNGDFLAIPKLDDDQKARGLR